MPDGSGAAGGQQDCVAGDAGGAAVWESLQHHATLVSTSCMLIWLVEL